ncbi:hypothetical protein FH712_12045 [Marinobacter nauticus]|uniref:hypothetical protein n=1 Tax=Marinobacter nauticus TaxID=2743 RepID=UPI00112FA568|nr:hypothetical protein [Marinobacter nauticus]TPW23212.1 hypothetical protein FH712_12045 [Marinobacter nauticus]
MVKSIALAGLLVLLLGLIIFQYIITSVPSLEPPITVSDARRVDDNNSLLVSLTGSEGRSFTLGLRGDIEDKPEEAALFFISRPTLVPYVYWPGFHSNDEKRVMNLLAAWDSNRKAHSEGAEHAAYQIYSVLKDRN